MDLRCPNCGSTDLKKASLAYEEGLSRIRVKSRLRGLLFADDGPNVIVGRAAANGVQQTELSRRLRPPKKWSYAKLVLWAGLVSIVSLVLCVHVVMASSTTVSSLPIITVGAAGLMAFLVLLFVTWRHNQLVYPRRLTEWQRLFICQRCAGISDHDSLGARS
jgi:hypothetical protein